MAALHVIDAARIAHETCREYLADTYTPDTWGAMSEVDRNHTIADAQDIIDNPDLKLPVAGTDDTGRLFMSVLNALRPFVVDEP